MQKFPSDRVSGFIVVCNIYEKINVPGVPSVHVRGQAGHEGCSPISGR